MALAVCVATGVLLWKYAESQQLDKVQEEALQMLDVNEGMYHAGKIVLTDTTHTEAKALAKKLDAKLRITKNGEFATLTLPEGVTIKDVYASKDNRQHISQMTPDFYVYMTDVSEEIKPLHEPGRPQYTVTDPGYIQQTYLDYLHVNQTWHTTRGSTVTVAVIDSGIDTDHPEFAGRISEYSYNVSEDRIVKDYLLEDGSYDWSVIEDEQGHGTMVTGVIAAAMDGDGIVGVAPEVEIIVIKANVDAQGHFSSASDIVFGIYYAIEMDVDVVNMSLGGYDGDVYSDVLRLAVDSDVICIAAAGNDGTTRPHYPSSDPNVIGVGALGADTWDLAPYSNYGENLDMVAPGTTYTTLMGGEYGYANGTSLATPAVTGAVALYLSQNPYSTMDSVREMLYASCYDLGDLGADWYYGYGALDIDVLVCQQKGTVTFHMLTEELDNMQKTFVRGHTLQDMPFPERLYAVFDGWYYDIECTEPLNLYADAFNSNLTLYAKWANEDDSVPYTYVELDDGTIEIRSYTGKRRYITIPEYIDGKVVSSVGEGAFAGQQKLRQVVLPAQLRTIKRGAFNGCSNLTMIAIPDTVTQIGQEAFRDNVRLSAVTFGQESNLRAIDHFAFQNCSRLERFEIPGSVAVLDGSVFYGAASIRQFGILGTGSQFMELDGVLLNAAGTSVVAYPAAGAKDYILPYGVKEIGTYAFAMSRLSTIDLTGVECIRGNAFANSRLERVTIPDSVRTLEANAFTDSSHLYQVKLGRGIQELQNKVFANCSALAGVEIPNTVM